MSERRNGAGGIISVPRPEQGIRSPCVWLVGGTRPEGVKLGPLVHALERQQLLRPVVVATGQHPSTFHQGMAALGRRPDRDIRLRRDVGTQAELAARLVEQLDDGLVTDRPAAVVVQGDTSSALLGALTAFWRQIPVVHLEAGLRSHDLASPFPEEANRRLIGQISALHLAPTRSAAEHLRAEGVSADRIRIVGNTVVDAALAVAGRADGFVEPALRAVEKSRESGRRLVLVTAHRRESWGSPLRAVLAAVRELVDRHADVTVVVPAHPNPVVRADVLAVLGGHERVVITEPLAYPDLVRLLERATLVLSDSGGIQEEAPTFGVPVLVLREKTERTEAVDAGCALLLGTDRARILATASRLLTDEGARRAMTAGGNPFGDGHASQRCAGAIARLLGFAVDPGVEFDPDQESVPSTRPPVTGWSRTVIPQPAALGTATVHRTSPRRTMPGSAGPDRGDARPASPSVPDPAVQGRTPRAVGHATKVLLDLVVPVFLLALLSPLLLAIAVAVRLDGGPVFFVQTRVGRDGREFRMLKFRSMVPGAERLRASLDPGDDGAGPLFKGHHDPRITRVGAVLRRYSLDELPQLFNVLTATMSLVGPRPPLPAEAATYTVAERRRLCMRPGMTGLWQVSGRSDLTWEQSIQLDLRYVDEWSLGMEARIIARTPRAVISGRGAY